MKTSFYTLFFFLTLKSFIYSQAELKASTVEFNARPNVAALAKYADTPVGTFLYIQLKLVITNFQLV